MNINAIVAVTKKAACIGAIKLRKRAPELLMAIGGTSVIGGTFLACKATLKVKEVIDERNELLEEIDSSEKTAPRLKSGGHYTPEDAKKDRRIVKLTALFNICKIFAPAAGLMILGMSCFASSHIIMAHRLTVMSTAYATLKANYDALHNEFIAYRNAIKEIPNGDKIDKEIFDKYPEDEKPIYTTDSMNGGTPYIFDESSTKWSKSPWRNKMMIEGVVGDLQRLLRTRGYVFLNDVNKAFDLPLTPEGQYLGWTDKVPESDEYGVISLGADVERFIKEVDEGKWDNCSATGIMFNPNVHGNILEFI